MAGCAALAGMAAGAAAWRAPAGAQAALQRWSRVQLVDEAMAPLKAAALVAHRSHVFAYPFEGTPCFLLDLGREVPGAEIPLKGAAAPYAWPGGVGRGRSVVAYSAICPHTYTHPNPETAMIHYFGPDTPATVSQRAGVVTCCVHGSTFEPGRGAVPLQPPAEIPLATVVLEWEETTDGLFAAGLLGRPVIEELFRSFPKASRREVSGVTPVLELSRYTRAVIPC